MASELSIKTVCHLTGINEHTLRMWERRHGAVNPSRTKTQRRRYSESDVQRLKLLLELTKHGQAISAIAPLSLAALQELIGSIHKLVPDTPNEYVPGMAFPQADAPHAAVFSVLKTLDSFDVAELQHQLTSLRVQHGSIHFILNVIPQLMGEVGNRVLEGKFTIAQEHTLSALIRTHLSEMILSLSSSWHTRPTATFAIAAPEGDYHDIGILMAQVLCTSKRCRTYFLGPSLPVSSLIEVANTLKVSHVLIGTSALKDGVLARPFAEFVSTLRDGLPTSIDVWIGGPKYGVDSERLVSLGVGIKTLSSLGELVKEIDGLSATPV